MNKSTAEEISIFTSKLNLKQELVYFGNDTILALYAHFNNYLGYPKWSQEELKVPTSKLWGEVDFKSISIFADN